MSYGRIKEVEPKLEAEVSELLRQAEAVDRVEDEEHGRKVRGDGLPEELQRRVVGSALPASLTAYSGFLSRLPWANAEAPPILYAAKIRLSGE